MASPTDGQRSADLVAWEAARAEQERAVVERYIGMAVARLAAEAWIGLATSHGAPAAERALLVQRRVQHAWLLHVWPAVDRMTASPSDPEALALYLALGWTQATTTHQWPATELWIERAKTRPEHWLPRSQWHLCWLLYDPASAEHRQGLDAALAEGRGDGARAGVAVGLAEVLGL